MKRVLLPACLLLAVAGSAQKKNSPAFFANTITASDMQRHLYIIAGPEMEGRDTPSPGLEKAADYIETQFKTFGLLPGNNDTYRQHYPLYKDSVTSTTFNFNDKKFALKTEFVPITSMNHAAALYFSEIVFVGYGIVDSAYDSYAGTNVRGKAVIMYDGAPAGYKTNKKGMMAPTNTFNKIRNAQEKGAAAVILVASNFPRNNFSLSSSWEMEKYRESINPQVFSVSTSVADQLIGADAKQLLTDMGATPTAKVIRGNLELTYATVTTTGRASNVLGIVEGSDKKDEYVIVTAHYDHVGMRPDGTIFYGADDDGSGTTAVIEMAEAFAKAKAAGKGPRRTVVFMTVSGEEKGLWGSAYYANHPVFPLEKTTVDLNIDMIGRIGNEYTKDKDSVNYVYVIGDDKLSTDLTPITDQVNKANVKMKLDRKYNDPKDPNRFYYRSDHYNFAEKGVPVIFYFNGVHPDYHRPGDTREKINYPLMAKRAKLVFLTAWEMANRNEMLKRDLKLDMPN